MKFLHTDDLTTALNQLPKLYVHNDVQYTLRELWSKGHTDDVEALGWQGVETLVPAYNSATHKLGDVTYTLTDGVITGEYIVIALSTEERIEVAKAQATQRIYTVVDQTAQMNLASAAAAGLLSASDMTTYTEGLVWVAGMRQAWKDIVAQGLDPTDDLNWPSVPVAVQELAQRY